MTNTSKGMMVAIASFIAGALVIGEPLWVGFLGGVVIGIFVTWIFGEKKK